MFIETVLRTNLVGIFERINSRDLNKLSSLIDDTYGGVVVGRVTNKLLVGTILSAKKNFRWTGSTAGDSKVGVGYYCDEAVYNTNFTHELCHNILWQMGRPDSMFDNYRFMANEEEKLCWQFSIDVCHMANLPLSKDVVDVSVAYWNFVMSLSDSNQEVEKCQNLDDVLIAIGQDEKRMFGFSHILGDEFYWQDDVPKLM